MDADVDSIIKRIKELSTQGEAHSIVKKILRAYFLKVWHKLDMGDSHADGDVYAGGLCIEIQMSADKFDGAVGLGVPEPSDVTIQWNNWYKVHNSHTMELSLPFSQECNTSSASDTDE